MAKKLSNVWHLLRDLKVLALIFTRIQCKIRPPISRAEGEALLKKDLARFEKCVESLTRIKLNSNQFSALCSFTFNLGCGAYQQSTLRRKLNAGNTKGASLEFRKWVYGGGKNLPGLVRRRKAERDLFCKSGGC
ncbi:unnamed protein product [Rhizophagus irregularis]|uniref:Lysozyme n=1 Tax=Rhizophagus irregularis TaxID=588596 RepID=A0A915Z206_9GLOM|nr:unnamed protein product [Rhizophagus irregularis]CAB5216913.1 unnamed protein product [Rhizophagus irregularis]CAB5358188.1 unnamed protein product [Rhizophagus irregularis]